MHIAILGAGQVGSALGRLWHAGGHDVTFAARDAARPQALAAELGERAHAAPVADAVAAADVVLVAVPGSAVTGVLQAAGSGSEMSATDASRACRISSASTARARPCSPAPRVISRPRIRSSAIPV